jgi:hypothetical protein
MHGTFRVGLAVGSLALSGVWLATAWGQEAAKAKEQPKMDFPQTTLSSDALKLVIALPDAQKGFYRGTRFAWSGIILRAQFQGHTAFAPFRPNGDPKGHDTVAGPAEEFGLDVPPPGYAEAKVGGAFVKIGVGVLEKVQEEKYGFWNTYRFVRPPEWKVTSAKDWIQFQQDLAEGDWGYLYTKRITLAADKPAFTIRYTLRNTCRKTIDTPEYCHNFTIIDDGPIGPDYRIAFGCDVSKPSQSRGQAEFKGREIVIPKVPADPIWAILTGPADKAEQNQVTIANQRTGAGVTIIGDQPFTEMRFYAEKTGACPEPFLRIKLAPGEERTWTTRYEFFVSQKQAKP